MNRMLIWNPAWSIYEPELRRRVSTPWRFECASDDDHAWLADRLPGAKALLAMALPADLRGPAMDLGAVFFPGAGYIHSEPDELPAGCVLSNVFEHDGPIAEYVLMAALMHVTQVRRYSESFAAGDWAGNGRTGGERHGELAGKTILLIGYGTIGKAVEARAIAFGTKVETVRSRHSIEELDAKLARADIVVVCCPLTAASRGMIDVGRLAAMADGALLVNVARGEIVEEAALFEALASGRISAALDAWYQYPVSTEQMLHGSRLPFHALQNVLVTPHYSAWTAEMVGRRMQAIAENLDRLAHGQPLERVVLEGAWRP